MSDKLRHHRIKFCRNHVALGHPGINADARASWNLEAFDKTWGRGEGVVRILGVEAHFDSSTCGSRRISEQSSSSRDMNL